MPTWNEALGRGYNEGKFREAMALACSFHVEEMYPDQEKHSEHHLKKVIFSSACTQSFSEPSS